MRITYIKRYKKNMKQILTKIKLWYQGYVEFHNHIQDKKRPRLLWIAHPASFLKRIIDHLISFWLQHWKWIIGTLIAFGVLLVMLWDHYSK